MVATHPPVAPKQAIVGFLEDMVYTTSFLFRTGESELSCHLFKQRHEPVLIGCLTVLRGLNVPLTARNNVVPVSLTRAVLESMPAALRSNRIRLCCSPSGDILLGAQRTFQPAEQLLYRSDIRTFVPLDAHCTIGGARARDTV